MGFHRAGMDRYTGFKSSPYTEGALFYGEKPVDAGITEAIESPGGPGGGAQAGGVSAQRLRLSAAEMTPPGPGGTES